MNLFLATLLPGLFLTALGLLLMLNLPVVTSSLKGLPRSPAATLLFFGGGMLWFLARVATMSEADRIFGSSNVPWVIGFAAIGVLSFKFAPDFLAVRGLCVLILLTATPLLQAAFMEYDHPPRLLLVTLVYAAIAAAIYLAAAPYRLRDFLQWLFAAPGRARTVGGALLVLGILLNVVSFTY